MSLQANSGCKKIVIIDPGLREHGGHHPAFILSMLNCDIFRNASNSLSIFANSAFEPSALINANSASIKCDVQPFFNIDFYRYFYEPTSHQELPGFIRRLATQYLAALTQSVGNELKLKANTKKHTPIYLFHTLGWEHAMALAEAMYRFKKQTDLQIRLVVLLMFSPYRQCEPNNYDHKVYLKFKLAFKSLASFDCISFFACDHETSKAYEHIFNRELALSPLPFIRHKDYARDHQKHNEQVILYLGDTKATKGFLALPSMLKNILNEDCGETRSFIIQYTLTNKSTEFVSVDKQLKELALLHESLSVFDEFWPEERLHNTLANGAAIVFNYNTAVYQYQSSGILWLAAHYHLKMIFLSENWLTREAERLQCDYRMCELNYLSESIKNIDCGHVNKNSFHANIHPQIKSQYEANLFGDFNSWLISILNGN